LENKLHSWQETEPDKPHNLLKVPAKTARLPVYSSKARDGDYYYSWTVMYAYEVAREEAARSDAWGWVSSIAVVGGVAELRNNFGVVGPETIGTRNR
jgi:hypothetical protein